MKEIFRYITDYLKSLNRKVFIACTLLAGLMIYLNFHYKIDLKIDEFDPLIIQFFCRYLVFLIAFALPYLFYLLFEEKKYFKASHYFYSRSFLETLLEAINEEIIPKVKMVAKTIIIFCALNFTG